MTVSVFGVNADDVRRHHFPATSSFDTTTSPTETTVTEMISSAGARLAGKLRLKSIDPKSITDATSEAYVWCADTIRLDTATRISPTTSGIDPQEHQRRIDELRDRYKDLSEGGADALGAGASANETKSEPEGPITFLTENDNIKTGDYDDASSAEPRLRLGDAL